MLHRFKYETAKVFAKLPNLTQENWNTIVEKLHLKQSGNPISSNDFNHPNADKNNNANAATDHKKHNLNEKKEIRIEEIENLTQRQQKVMDAADTIQDGINSLFDKNRIDNTQCPVAKTQLQQILAAEGYNCNLLLFVFLSFLGGL